MERLVDSSSEKLRANGDFLTVLYVLLYCIHFVSCHRIRVLDTYLCQIKLKLEEQRRIHLKSKEGK
ncbi:hypothetical protein PUW24_14635 [Paenibacillus urinalis]|uniref:Transmembrane protein n=1 Tax=Paenibacillus urinalis TaxID=521520 RepID=A0ABY7XCY3_9BACL|nr:MULTISPECIES: hypothetical protein [Paenibacillus]WDH95454.1 hypothetical protein PUW24_14635 [Paenibacillus urinalis]WDI03651.1 hypothetical protein PUW25_06760 [Paenibacillus urinalis]GAK39023.1 hypothetical protein TCA2_0749 [Paenibacillus sp. TCA20]